MQHKWRKEIKAWADGAEIQFRTKYYDFWGNWIDDAYPDWNIKHREFRIKPQQKQSSCCPCKQTSSALKEPQDVSSTSYLYVYNDDGFALTSFDKPRIDCGNYIGKIKLETE